MRKHLLIFIALVLTVLSGCERRPLEYGSSNLDLRLNIKLDVKVNGQVKNLPKPEMMRVMFFDPDTYELVTESYLPAEGGRISLPPGRYKFIGYNFDTEATLLRNDRNYYSIEAYTNEISSALKSSLLSSIQYGRSAATKTGDDRAWSAAFSKVMENPIIYEPDHLFVSHQDIEVFNTSEPQTIETEAETIIETWKISVKISNEQYIASARALITGQIASNFIGLPKEQGKTDTDATLMFDMDAGSDSRENDVLVGTFNTFGKNPNVESRLWLTIIIKTVGGDTLEWHRDITEEFTMDDAINDQTIHIEDGEIVIPEPENPAGGSGGFQPGVNDWDEEDIPINI